MLPRSSRHSNVIIIHQLFAVHVKIAVQVTVNVHHWVDIVTKGQQRAIGKAERFGRCVLQNRDRRKFAACLAACGTLRSRWSMGPRHQTRTIRPFPSIRAFAAHQRQAVSGTLQAARQGTRRQAQPNSLHLECQWPAIADGKWGTNPRRILAVLVLEMLEVLQVLRWWKVPSPALLHRFSTIFHVSKCFIQFRAGYTAAILSQIPLWLLLNPWWLLKCIRKWMPCLAR